MKLRSDVLAPRHPQRDDPADLLDVLKVEPDVLTAPDVPIERQHDRRIVWRRLTSGVRCRGLRKRKSARAVARRVERKLLTWPGIRDDDSGTAQVEGTVVDIGFACDPDLHSRRRHIASYPNADRRRAAAHPDGTGYLNSGSRVSPMSGMSR